MAYPIVKLLHGSDKLDLMSAANGGTGRYKVSTDFAPPTAQRSVTLGETERGMGAVDKRLVNTDFVFAIHVKARTDQELERAKRELQSFLNRAGGATPLYLAYRSYDDYDYEPFFGLHGAFARYEIVHGYLDPSPMVTNTKAFIGLRVNLTIKPQAVFPLIPAGYAKGAIIEDTFGVPNGRARGTIIAPSITSGFTNPAFMNETYNTDWTATGTGFVVSKNTDMEYVLVGSVSARCSKSTVAAGDRLTQSLTLTGATTFYLSCYTKMIDSSAVSGINFWYDGGSVVATTTAIGAGWYKLTASITGTGSASDTGITATSTTTPFFVDAFQVNATQQRPFVYGDYLGCVWAGTKNRSNTTSTVAYLRYAFDKFLGVRTGWTMRFVWLPPVGTTGNRFFLEDSDSAITVLLTSSNTIRVDVAASNTVTSSAITVTAGTPLIIHATYDGSTITIYNAGASIGTDSSKVAAAANPTYVYIGSDSSVGNHAHGTFMDVATFQRPMTAAQVLADYNQITQQATDGERIGPLPWFWADGGDGVLDNDNDGTEANYAVVGGLMGDDVDIEYQIDSDNSFVTRTGVIWGSLPVDPREFDKDILTSGGTNTLLFKDGSGTANTSANGNAVMRLSSLTTSIQPGPATAITARNARLLRDAKSVVGYFVGVDTGTVETVQVQLVIHRSADINDAMLSPWRTLATDTSLRPYVTFEMPIDVERDILDGSEQLGFALRFQRTTGTANFDVSHAVFFINYAAVYLGDIGATGTTDSLYVRGRTAYTTLSTAATTFKSRRPFNAPLYIQPERLNALMFQHNFHNYAASKATWASSADTTASVTVEQFSVAPRFDIY